MTEPALRLGVDAVQLVIAYLAGRSDVQTVLGNPARIGTKLNDSPVFPCIVIIRVGGSWDDIHHLDSADLQIEAWADQGKGQEKVAEVAAATIRACFARDQIPGVHTLGVVTGSVERYGPTWSWDPPTGRPRYVFGVRLFIHPNPAA
jgi:hypothetical protein